MVPKIDPKSNPELKNRIFGPLGTPGPPQGAILRPFWAPQGRVWGASGDPVGAILDQFLSLKQRTTANSSRYRQNSSGELRIAANNRRFLAKEEQTDANSSTQQQPAPANTQQQKAAHSKLPTSYQQQHTAPANIQQQIPAHRSS